MVSDIGFTGKSVVITGAGSGIGLATAHAFVKQGAAVALIDLSEKALGDAYAELLSLGASVVCIPADVSQSSDIAKAAAIVVERLGRVDVLVNSAGIVRWGGTTDTDESDWDAVLSVNLKGTWLASRAFIPLLALQNGSAIVNVSSNLALKGAANLVAYSASKGGLLALTRSMAVDLAAQGIRVNCVAPGHTRTPMGDRAASRLGLTAEGIRQLYPIGRVGEANEVASVIMFLASSSASFMTGSVVSVDGGFTT
jgi:3alpha(or 20beta)-hydroxysteroid dehydrogenase